MSRVSVSPLLQAALRRPTALVLPRCTATATATKPATARTFTHLPTLRPTTLSRSPIFRAPGTSTTTMTQFTPSATTTTATGEATLDLVSKTAVSSHPALAGCASQMRCGPRPTMSGASRLIQKRRHGFLSRIATNKGRKTLARRRAKGRKKLGHA